MKNMKNRMQNTNVNTTDTSSPVNILHVTWHTVDIVKAKQ